MHLLDLLAAATVARFDLQQAAGGQRPLQQPYVTGSDPIALFAALLSYKIGAGNGVRSDQLSNRSLPAAGDEPAEDAVEQSPLVSDLLASPVIPSVMPQPGGPEPSALPPLAGGEVDHAQLAVQAAGAEPAFEPIGERARPATGGLGHVRTSTLPGLASEPVDQQPLTPSAEVAEFADVAPTVEAPLLSERQSGPGARNAAMTVATALKAAAVTKQAPPQEGGSPSAPMDNATAAAAVGTTGSSAPTTATTDPAMVDSTQGSAMLDRPFVAPQPELPSLPLRLLHQTEERLTVRMDVRELGSIAVDLTHDGQLLDLSLQASRPDTTQLLGRNLDELLSGLQDRHIDIGGAKVSTGATGTDAQTEQSGRNWQQAGGQGGGHPVRQQAESGDRTSRQQPWMDDGVLNVMV